MGGRSAQQDRALSQGCRVVIGQLNPDGVRLKPLCPAAHRRVDMRHAEESDVAAEEAVLVRITGRSGKREGSLPEGLELHHAGQMIQWVVEEGGVSRIDLHLPGC